MTSAGWFFLRRGAGRRDGVATVAQSASARGGEASNQRRAEADHAAFLAKVGLDAVPRNRPPRRRARCTHRDAGRVSPALAARAA